MIGAQKRAARVGSGSVKCKTGSLFKALAGIAGALARTRWETRTVSNKVLLSHMAGGGARGPNKKLTVQPKLTATRE